MRLSKRTGLLVLGISMLILFGVCFFLIDREPGTDEIKEKYDRIQDGMNRKEVLQLIGRAPDGRYSVIPTHKGRYSGAGDIWAFDDCGVAVYFDETGRVMDKQWFDREIAKKMKTAKPSFFQWVRNMLGL